MSQSLRVIVSMFPLLLFASFAYADPGFSQLDFDSAARKKSNETPPDPDETKDLKEGGQLRFISSQERLEETEEETEPKKPKKKKKRRRSSPISQIDGSR